ncbi:hypothetical protein [Arthrobacter sp. efr-133-TYG-118]|uniref:hypothetical protein n=1 Tax=Arthrobacter sp. efr-133-TYG-118 TaxID=3040279 RepID=UPI00254B46B6|nr:hypothetical protein [Arthrobacter sp. efr-133-TYG-118]
MGPPQRAADARGELAQDRLAELDRVDSWRRSFQATRDEERWQRRLLQLVSFRSSNNSLPKWKNPADETQRLLGT